MLRVSGIPPGGLIVGVCAVLGVLLPVLRRRQSVAAMWVWDSSQQVLATQGALSSGFNNIRTFNRVFKEITGYTPSQFLSLDDPDSINLSYYKRKSPHQEFVEYDSLTLVRNDERSVSHEKTNPVPQTPHS